MKKIFFLFLTLILCAGIAYAKDYEVSKKAGEYNVLVTIDKNPPVTGNNNVNIEIKDASGKYVSDATVVVDYSMAAMQGMPAMHYKTDAELKGDGYGAVVNLSMAGSWNIAVKIKKQGKTSTVKFTVDAK